MFFIMVNDKKIKNKLSNSFNKKIFMYQFFVPLLG